MPTSKTDKKKNPAAKATTSATKTTKTGSKAAPASPKKKTSQVSKKTAPSKKPVTAKKGPAPEKKVPKKSTASKPRAKTTAKPKAKPAKKAAPTKADKTNSKTAKPATKPVAKTATKTAAKTVTKPKIATKKTQPKSESQDKAKVIKKAPVQETMSSTDPAPQERPPTTPAKPTKKPASRQRNKPTSKAKEPQKHSNNDSQSPSESTNQEYKLLINADSPEECRVALLEKGKLTSFHVETVVSAQQKGNIYKGKIVSVEANLQAAFVDIGTGKNAFLAFSEIHPEYYATEEDQDKHWKDLSIKKVIQEGQELLVEVVKEATGNKGANMTTFLSLPGRYVVLMIGSTSKGISRQIDNREQRNKLREMLESCKLPEGVGYIIRTASKNITKKALTTDVRFLINQWNDIKEKGQSLPPASLVYQEQNIVARFLRDHFTQEIQEILVDSQEAYNQVLNFLELLPAAQRKKTRAKLHKGPRPLLNSFNVEEQIEQIYQPTVKLPSGGSIVINPTEALVAIDVNSGRTDKNNNFEETIFLANMEAAEELARQLQLRDLGGLIVVDFIDMRSNSHIREVEKKVKSCMKRDKAKVDFCRISKFGLLQISRQKMAAPVLAGNYKTCEHCHGRGIVKSVETQALVYLRQIQTGVTKRQVKVVQCRLPLEVGHYLLNKKRTELGELERRYKTGIVIETDSDMPPSQGKIQFIKN